MKHKTESGNEKNKTEIKIETKRKIKTKKLTLVTH